jgi:hypothetical protein
LINLELKNIAYPQNAIITGDYCIGLALQIGVAGQKGADNFFATVGTAKGIRTFFGNKPVILNRGLIITDEFNLKLIRKEVQDILPNCSKENWEDSAWSVNRYFPWEYDEFKLGRN